MPWGADGYSPLDLTLNRRFEDIEEWRQAIIEIHARDVCSTLSWIVPRLRKFTLVSDC